MADTPRSASLSEALVRQGLAGTGASELLRPAFSLLVLDFNQELLLVSGACVTREGQARPIWIAPGARLLELFSALDRQVVAPLVTDALSGRPGMTKLEAGAAIGDRVLRISILPRQVDGRQCGVILSAQDITARQTGLSRLVALEDRLRAILSHAADAIVVIDTDGMIEGVNAAAERLTGWTEAELVGGPIVRLMDEPYRSQHPGKIEHYLLHGVSGILNVGPRLLPLRHRDGHTVPIELSVGEAVIAGERKFIGVCRDISQRLRQDEALRLANAELRGKIGELERVSAGLEAQSAALQALAEEARAAWEHAERANHAKSRFLATMSHELRTPLNGVLAVAEALSRRHLAEGDLELVNIIRSSGQGLLSILNEVLDLARIEAGALAIDAQPFSPREAVNAVAEVWRFAAEAKGVRLEIETVRLPQALNGDVQRLRQVLSNLVNNAIKFTERGTVILSARAVGASGKLRFSVTDSGPGIAEADRERLFEPFVQADAGVTRRHGGAGLGLAICRELVTLMGGRIWAEAPPAGGARIVAEIPFSRAAGLDPVIESDEPSRAPMERLDPLILVAEDHPLNRRVAGIVLEEAGLRCEFAEDGVEAVQAVETGRFDLVLMDVHMPRMDGLQAAREIRRLPGAPGAIPIIAVTANASTDEALACREAGMNACLAKPIDAGDLLREIVAQLDADQNAA